MLIIETTYGEPILYVIVTHKCNFQIMEFAQSMGKDDKAIVFCGKKARADDLSSEMSLKGFEVQCIHGDRDQVTNLPIP